MESIFRPAFRQATPAVQWEGEWTAPSEELAKFRRWFAQFDEAAWDAQIEADTAAGKLDALATEARAEYDNGKAREL